MKNCYDYDNKETDNSWNDPSKKTMYTSYWDMQVEIPWNRKGEYEPQLIPKYATSLTNDMEEIKSHMKDLYGVDISDNIVSRITDRIILLVKEWQERLLKKLYAVVYMDAIHYHVHSEGWIVKHAVYVIIGIDMSGKKREFILRV